MYPFQTRRIKFFTESFIGHGVALHDGGRNHVQAELNESHEHATDIGIGGGDERKSRGINFLVKQSIESTEDKRATPTAVLLDGDKTFFSELTLNEFGRQGIFAHDVSDVLRRENLPAALVEEFKRVENFSEFVAVSGLERNFVIELQAVVAQNFRGDVELQRADEFAE